MTQEINNKQLELESLNLKIEQKKYEMRQHQLKEKINNSEKLAKAKNNVIDPLKEIGQISKGEHKAIKNSILKKYLAVTYIEKQLEFSIKIQDNPNSKKLTALSNLPYSTNIKFHTVLNEETLQKIRSFSKHNKNFKQDTSIEKEKEIINNFIRLSNTFNSIYEQEQFQFDQEIAKLKDELKNLERQASQIKEEISHLEQQTQQAQQSEYSQGSSSNFRRKNKPRIEKKVKKSTTPKVSQENQIEPEREQIIENFTYFYSKLTEKIIFNSSCLEYISQKQSNIIKDQFKEDIIQYIKIKVSQESSYLKYFQNNYSLLKTKKDVDQLIEDIYKHSSSSFDSYLRNTSNTKEMILFEELDRFSTLILESIKEFKEAKDFKKNVNNFYSQLTNRVINKTLKNIGGNVKKELKETLNKKFNQILNESLENNGPNIIKPNKGLLLKESEQIISLVNSVYEDRKSLIHSLLKQITSNTIEEKLRTSYTTIFALVSLTHLTNVLHRENFTDDSPQLLHIKNQVEKIHNIMRTYVMLFYKQPIENSIENNDIINPIAFKWLVDRACQFIKLESNTKNINKDTIEEYLNKIKDLYTFNTIKIVNDKYGGYYSNDIICEEYGEIIMPKSLMDTLSKNSTLDVKEKSLTEYICTHYILSHKEEILKNHNITEGELYKINEKNIVYDLVYNKKLEGILTRAIQGNFNNSINTNGNNVINDCEPYVKYLKEQINKIASPLIESSIEKYLFERDSCPINLTTKVKQVPIELQNFSNSNSRENLTPQVNERKTEQKPSSSIESSGEISSSILNRSIVTVKSCLNKLGSIYR